MKRPNEQAAAGRPARLSATEARAHAGRAAVDEALIDVTGRFGLDSGQREALRRLLDALAAEPDPPTRIASAREALDGHVADSLVALELAPLRAARTVADLGSGAGFPALPLAVALERTRFDLVESAIRKCAVIERLAQAAGARNVRAVAVRAEEWAAGGGRGAYDAVTARALASLPVLVEYAAPLLRLNGALVAWKGAAAAEEEAAAVRAAREVGLEFEEVRAVSPFAGAHSRRLYVYRKVGDTPERYPRRAGMAVKRPLGA